MVSLRSTGGTSDDEDDLKMTPELLAAMITLIGGFLTFMIHYRRSPASRG